MWVIWNPETRKLVSAYHDRAYTDRLQNARVWKTYAAADRNKCGNEVIIDVMSYFSPP